MAPLSTRRIVAGLTAASLAAVIATPQVLALKPVAGCPTGFELGPMTLEASLVIKYELGFPPEAEPFYAQLFEDTDKNHNGLLCLKDLPDTPGIAASVFQLADDVSSAR